MKRTLAMLLAVLMMGGLVACGAQQPVEEPTTPTEPAETTTTEAPAPEKTVLNIWAFTDEVPGMCEKFLELNPDFAEKYELNVTITATTDGLYQPALDQALAAGGDNAPDLYAAEAAFILKYSQGDASKYAATYESMGIDVDAKIKEADIAQYSVDIGTRDGDVVALGYQATGGVFIYRASIAEKVFGSSDPEVVKEAIGGGSGSWDKFWEAAEELKKAGHPIVSGDGDIWHPIENSSSTGWIVDGKLTISPEREAFLDVSKKLVDNGYHNDTTDWQEGWFADMNGTSEKNAFGFFGPAWLLNYSLADNCGDTFGDWRVCESPIGFFWGGTWLLANKDSKNLEAIGEIIEWITLDSSEEGLQYKWANGTLNGEGGTKDCVASGTVMEKSDGAVDICGGQNIFDAFVPANAYANGKCLTQYDEIINKEWRDQVTLYAHGEKDRDAAIADFKTAVGDKLDIIVE